MLCFFISKNFYFFKIHAILFVLLTFTLKAGIIESRVGVSLIKITMPFAKRAKDYILKFISGKEFVPHGLVEINRYFRFYEPIEFEYKQEGDITIAISQNFQHGSIITSGKNPKELDKNIRDAILTSFEIPSSYSKETKLINLRENKHKAYAIA